MRCFMEIPNNTKKYKTRMGQKTYVYIYVDMYTGNACIKERYGGVDICNKHILANINNDILINKLTIHTCK